MNTDFHLNRRQCLGTALAASGLFHSPFSFGQSTDFPVRPVKVVVPFAPGGSVDQMARHIGGKLLPKWGQPLVVESKPGANSILGADLAAREATLAQVVAETGAEAVPPYDDARELRDQIDADRSPQHKVIREVFRDANNYMKSGPQMLAVIEKLEAAINFHDFKTRASLGDVYEQMLNDLRGAGNAGEFYTPRAITAFMADRVNPRLDKRETVMDPACGTGGFLTAAIDHFRNQLTGARQFGDFAPAHQLLLDPLGKGVRRLAARQAGEVSDLGLHLGLGQDRHDIVAHAVGERGRHLARAEQREPRRRVDARHARLGDRGLRQRRA